MYCGNNRKNRDVVSGRRKIGTRYACFKKGVGVGINLPYDPDFDGEYSPINREKIYCGTKRSLPENYDSMGSIVACFQKGVGVGKRKKAQKRILRKKSVRKSRKKSVRKSRKKSVRKSRKKSVRKRKKSR